MNEPASSPAAFLRRLAEERFWGNITFLYQNGTVVLVRQEQTFKPTHQPEQLEPTQCPSSILPK